MTAVQAKSTWPLQPYGIHAHLRAPNHEPHTLMHLPSFALAQASMGRAFPALLAMSSCFQSTLIPCRNIRKKEDPKANNTLHVVTMEQSSMQQVGGCPRMHAAPYRCHMQCAACAVRTQAC